MKRLVHHITTPMKKILVQKKIIFVVATVFILSVAFLNPSKSYEQKIDAKKTTERHEYYLQWYENFSRDQTYQVDVRYPYCFEELPAGRDFSIADNTISLVVTSPLTKDEFLLDWAEQHYQESSFKWIVWEKNSYNFWVMSGDVGSFRYTFRPELNKWKIEKDALFEYDAFTNHYFIKRHYQAPSNEWEEVELAEPFSPALRHWIDREKEKVSSFVEHENKR